jgi:hypothetical protein
VLHIREELNSNLGSQMSLGPSWFYPASNKRRTKYPTKNTNRLTNKTSNQLTP